MFVITIPKVKDKACLLVPQFVPVKPSAQSHVIPVESQEHFPLFLHGSLKQGSLKKCKDIND